MSQRKEIVAIQRVRAFFMYFAALNQICVQLCNSIQDDRFGSKVGQSGPKPDKSETFKTLFQ